MRIASLRFKAGSAVGAAPLELEAKAVTVFVGPNYSGKSQAVSEIAVRLQSGDVAHSNLVLDDIKVSPLSNKEADAVMSGMTLKPLKNEIVHPGHELFGMKQDRFQIPPDMLRGALVNPEGNKNNFSQWYSRFKTLVLSGSNRIALVNDQPAGDLQSPAVHSFQFIFRNDKLRRRLSELVFRSLGLYLLVDPTSMGQLRLRFSREKPRNADLERSLTQEAVDFHSEATLVNSTSDGAKAFVGIMSEILAGDPSVLLIDEPEAFLHPSLAFQLGLEIASEISSSSKQMFVSTHSSHFIMGCLQSGVDVNIVRLTYRDGVATARLMPSANLRSLMRNPLLRSANVVSAIFHESVVVTESDADRAFYQEINERLLRENKGRGIPNSIFLNAQNKQTIPTIIAPLRKLGIPAAAIYDIDLLKDGGATAVSFLSSAGVPDLSINSMTTMRANIFAALKATGKDFKKHGGVEVLSGSDREAAIGFISNLQEYGAFVIKGGELESWFKAHSVTGHGPPWLISMFEKLGEDPNTPEYVHPGEGDVWDFLAGIKAWLHNPERKGIPL